MATTLPVLLAGLAAPAGGMALAWLRQRRTGDAGIVDVLWAASIGALAVAWCLLGEGWAPRRALVGLLAGAWALRLAVHLGLRVARGPEDGRYARLRERWGERFQGRLFWFFQAQALLAFLLSLPFLLLAQAPGEGWRWSDAAALALWVVALAGEHLADRQLARWRADPARRGRTCRAGLWRLSRHPNYFFEWLGWLAWPVMGLGVLSGGRALAIWAAPAALLFLILRVTGIPPTEEQALASRGEDYRAYQTTTNAFFPGPPRRAAERAP